MLGAIMYASKIVLEFLPNIHLLGVFTIALTLVYRQKALYPISGFVLITGLLNGFPLWWIPYLYLWGLLWGAAMLLPKEIPAKLRPIVYMLLNALFGFLYGALYAPVQAILFGLDFEGMCAWILAGLPWDAVHGVGNLFSGILIVPLSGLIRRIERLPQRF